METLGRVTATVLVLAVVVFIIWFVTQPKVIAEFDANGLPVKPQPKEGDKAVAKNNIVYIYTNGAWIVFVPPPPPNDEERGRGGSFRCPDWSNRAARVRTDAGVPFEWTFMRLLGVNINCPSCIIWNGYRLNLYKTTFSECIYRR